MRVNKDDGVTWTTNEHGDLRIANPMKPNHDVARIYSDGKWVVFDPAFGGRSTAYGQAESVGAAKLICERQMTLFVKVQK